MATSQPAGSAKVAEYDGTHFRDIFTRHENKSYASPNAAGTTAYAAITDLGCFRSMSVYTQLQGGTGGTLDVYLQYLSADATTWIDFAHWAQLAAAAATLYRVWSTDKSKGQALTTVNSASGTPVLAANTFLDVDWGDQIRVIMTAGAGTSAGASQEFRISFSP